MKSCGGWINIRRSAHSSNFLNSDFLDPKNRLSSRPLNDHPSVVPLICTGILAVKYVRDRKLRIGEKMKVKREY